VPTNAPTTGSRAELLRLYGLWRTWTIEEGDAIRAGNWPELERLQTRKRSLQDSILAASRAGERAGDGNLRRLVEELIAMESRNAESLAGLLREGRAQREALEAGFHRLRQVRKSYCPERAAGWQSYS
jgi:hypothetical protein